MAAGIGLTQLNNTSSANSSSFISPPSEISLNDYSEDFHSSGCSSAEETDFTSSNAEAELAVVAAQSDDSVDHDLMSKFFSRKLRILSGSRLSCTKRPTEPNMLSSPSGIYQEISPFYRKKLEILRNRVEDKSCNTNGLEPTLENGIGSVKKDISRNDASRTRPECSGSEIAPFQSAFERLRFDNLRLKCQRFIKSDIHCARTCRKCNAMKQVSEVEFYKKRVRTLKQQYVHQKLESHLQTRSSALLIAKVIEDGPKPSWSSNELWDKLLSGGYQGMGYSI